MKKNTNSKGFTLIELMIVIAILGILAGIAAPNFQTYMTRMRLNGAARQIMTDLMEARSKAVSGNNRFRVFFLDDHQYKVLDDDNNNNAEDSGETTITRDIQDEYYGVTLSKTADPIFYPRGTAYGTTIKLTNSSGLKYVKVALTGRIKIDDTP